MMMRVEMSKSRFKSSSIKAEGFSLPGVLVGVALMSISATIISQTVVNSRRTQKASELKLTSNKFQQAALDAVTERAKEFVLEDCFGARWGGSGLEVEKAFRELPITTESGVTTSLKFTKSKASLDLLDGHADVKRRCENPVDPGVMGSGQYIMSFCMEITPTGSPQIDYRLLELLIVPVELASDQAKSCRDARGAAAGIKVTWQMYNQMDNKKVSGSGSGKTVLKESGVFLVSMETESYAGSCSVDAKRIGTSDKCSVNVSGLGRRPPKLFKNGAIVTGFIWERTASNVYDAFKAEVTCETNLVSNFRAQANDGSVFCDAQPVPIGCYSPYPGYACTLENTHLVGNFNGGGTIRDSCYIPGRNAVSKAGTMTINSLSKIIGDKIFSSNPGSQDDVVLLLKSDYTVPGMTSTSTVAVPDNGLFFQFQQNGAFDGCNNTYTYRGRAVQRSSYGSTAGLAAGLVAPLVGPYSISISQLKNLGYANGDSLSFSLWLIAQGAGSFSLGLVIPKCICQ
jgi:type II secretory pathway pseudopilin PulG